MKKVNNSSSTYTEMGSYVYLKLKLFASSALLIKNLVIIFHALEPPYVENSVGLFKTK